MSNGASSALFDSITPLQVTTYLKRKGWTQEQYPNQKLLVFVSPDEKTGTTIVLPSKQEFADYLAKLRDCITVLSYTYEEEVQDMAYKIAHWNRDVMRIRLANPLQPEQLLPLNYASKMIQKYRDFIAYSASTEATPRKFFAKLTSAGNEFAGDCMFGHTFVGSFGLTIECPLDLDHEIPMRDAPQQRPFRRAVTERIATGYNDVRMATEKEDPEIIVKNHRAGFSGNMCEILSDIYEMSEGREISHKMIWAPELAPPPHLESQYVSIGLNERTNEVLKVASEILQTVEEPDEDKVIIGRITSLRSDKPPVKSDEYASATRTIVVLWEMDKRQPLKVHIGLTLDQYHQACDAHKIGRKISITGKPKKIGKFWNLLEHHSFHTI